MKDPDTPSSAAILSAVERYYADRLGRFGATPRGVDWNSPESQELRFDRLLELVRGEPPAPAPAPASGLERGPDSILDVGCGYGALLDYLRAHGNAIAYAGFDISPAMIEAARGRHVNTSGCAFTADAAGVTPAMYAVASGIFNVKLEHPVERWREYVTEILARLDRWSLRGFSFNMLSLHSDPERRRPDLFYADPSEVFELCRRHWSPRVALLHDYPLYEFTVVVRK